MTKTYTWTTPKGAKVEATITTNHITTKTINDDGWSVEVKCNEWHYFVESMKVNGKPTKQKDLWYHGKQHCIIIDRIGKDTVMAAIPDDIANEIFGEEERYNDAKWEATLRIEQAQEDHRRAVYDTMMGNTRRDNK